MKCLILAAGYATRLYPLTANFPKPLLKVGGSEGVPEKPILDWLLDDIEKSGKVSSYIVVSNHRFAPHFREWRETRNEEITVLDDGTETNETRLGAVRDIALAIDTLELRDDLLIIAGDNVLDFSLCAFLDYAERMKTSCLMRYYEPSPERLKKCGVIEVDETDLVTGMKEKPEEPKSHWCCPPFYFYCREDTRLVCTALDGGECGTDAPGSFAAWLCGKRPVHAMVMPGKRYDIGNLQSYEQVCREYRGIVTE